MLHHFTPTDRAFHALADPTRRALLARLATGPADVSALAAPLPISLPAVLQHLAVLRDAGLVVTEKRGRVRHCRLEPAALRLVETWMADRWREWEARLDRLAAYLAPPEDPHHG